LENDKPLPSDRRIGQVFGHYLVEEQIGRGGMGVVFRARHELSGDVVALKLMAPDLAGNETFRERFIREAEAGPTLKHPNVVQVFESGEADGELYIAMQLIEGSDLKDLIKQEGRLDPKRALPLLQQAASALDAAHEAGMVHRDVKPQNILVIPREDASGSDRVYLTDFGLVRPLTSESSASGTGQLIGSVAYMAPELIEGIPADGRADVYALGCVVFECLTGKVPFERENEIATVWAHIHEDPPLLTDTCDDLPGGLDDAVFKAMAKHPDDRFLTCGEFVDELGSGLGRKLSRVKHSHVRPLVPRIPRRKTERDVWSPNFFPELSRVREASRERFDWRRGVALVAAVVALATVQGTREGGLPQAVADVADAAVDAKDGFVEAAFGTDGRGANDARGESASREQPSDRTVSAIGQRGGDASGDLHDTDEDETPAGGALPAHTSGTTDGRGRIVFHRFTGCMHYSECADVYSVRLDGTGLVNLTPGSLYGANPEWSPDGRQILFTGWTQTQQSSDLWVTDIWVMNADGSDLTNLTQTLHISEADGSWSPDGDRIAFARRSDGAGIWTMKADGSDRRQLTSNADGDLAPDWSPDGRRIAFERREGCPAVGSCNAVPDIWVVDARGNSLRRLGTGRAPQWSPSGGEIAFDLDAGTASNSDIYLMESDGTNARRLTRSRSYEVSPSWSPDGRRLIFQYEGVLVTMGVRDTGMRQITDVRTCNAPSWQPPARA
jgi:serine/threonine protein kinase/Tol biopolymer transport system component